MAGWRFASIWLKIALLTLILATLLFVIGFATVAWTVADNRYQSDEFGLWNRELCKDRKGGCQSHEVKDDYLRYFGWFDWYKAVQVLECLGLICLVVSLVLLVIFFFAEAFKRRAVLIATIILTFFAVGAIIIGAVVMASKHKDSFGAEFGWSMGLAVVGAIFAFISGIMQIIELCK